MIIKPSPASTTTTHRERRQATHDELTSMVTYVALCGLLLVWSTRIYPDRPSFGIGASFLMIAVGQAILERCSSAS